MEKIKNMFPKFLETYYYINAKGDVKGRVNRSSTSDIFRFYWGNYFPKIQDALDEANWEGIHRRMIKLADGGRYFIYYDGIKGIFSVCEEDSIKTSIYKFSSEEKARRALEYFGNDGLKLLFRMKEE